jgi:hypothetical protein
VTVALVLLVGLAANLVIGWLESVLQEEPKLRRFADRHALALLEAMCKAMTVTRTAIYDVTVQDAEGHRVSGRAYVGGPWTHPAGSSLVEMKLHDMTLSDS